MRGLMPTTSAARIANDSPFCESRQNMTKLEDDLISPEAMSAPLHEIEQLLRAQGREMLRSLMQAHFDRRSAQEQAVEVRDVAGVERDKVRRGSRTVMTEFGEVALIATCTRRVVPTCSRTRAARRDGGVAR